MGARDAADARRRPPHRRGAARRADIEALGGLGYALYNGRDARSALEAFVRYHDLINDSGKWRLDVSDC